MEPSYFARIQRLIEIESQGSWHDESDLIETEIGSITAITKTKTASKLFASTSKEDEPSVRRSVLPTQPVKCTAREETHPLWRWPVFRGKKTKQRAKVFADNKLCFLWLNGQHSFRQCPKLRKRTVEGCWRSHNVLLHAAEQVFPPGPLPK